MLIPIRCFTCGKVLADKYDFYMEKVQEMKKKMEDTQVQDVKASTNKKDQKDQKDKKEDEHKHRHFDPLRTGAILDKLEVKRFCCRRMFLGTEDMMEII